MSGERFYVVELDGFTEIGTSVQILTAYVLDRAYCHRVVGRFPQVRGGGEPGRLGGITAAQSRQRCRTKAAAEAARLNAWAARA